MYQVKFVNETAALILKRGKEFIDVNFYNQFDKENMTLEELFSDIKNLIKKYNIKEYALDLTEFKTC
ncbi:hypothetical protein [Bacillus smithii]|uniref:hypothetical protein n=1 Tax=Bacillus smithii TaxID=1479 RepID=UPI003D1FFD3B